MRAKVGTKRRNMLHNLRNERSSMNLVGNFNPFNASVD